MEAKRSFTGPQISCWMNIGRRRAMQTHVVLPYIAALWRGAEYRDKLTTEVVHGENGVANTVLLPNVDEVMMLLSRKVLSVVV